MEDAITYGERAGGLKGLKQHVLGGPACAACGACVGLCPYIKCIEDHVAAVADCRKEDGRCFLFCPRAHEPHAGSPAGNTDLGIVVRALRGHRAPGVASAEAGAASQHGGAVGVLLTQALRSGLIEAAVVTRLHRGRPQTFLARTEAEIASAAGSKFAVAPTVAEVNKLLVREKLERVPLGVVALPCQAAALARMRSIAEERNAAVAVGATGPDWYGRPFPTIALIVGLFCTWSLSQQGWLRVVEEARRGLGRAPGDVTAIVRSEIPPPPANVLEIEFDDGAHAEVSLDMVREHIREGCRLCDDMTSEDADVSVGLVEGLAGWNTIITRTAVGDGLVDAAAAGGLLEIAPLEGERLEHLGWASRGKGERALRTAAERELDLPYLRTQRGDHD